MKRKLSKRITKLVPIFLAGLVVSAANFPRQEAWADKISSTGKVQAKVPLPPKKPPAGSTQLSSPKLKIGSPEFMWKASSQDGATLFIVGTIHAVKPEFYPLPQEIEDALAKSKALLVEIDPSKTDPAKVQSLTTNLGTYGQTDSLANHISPETLKALNASGVAPQLMQTFMRMKPWLVGILLVQTELIKLGYIPKNGIDSHLIQHAQQLGKKVVALETEEFQLGVIAGLPADLQDKMLERTLIELEQTKTEAGQLVSAWQKGDDKAMDFLLTKDLKEHPELTPVQEKLIYDRNVSMTSKLEGYLKGSDTFIVAVGSAHLVGDRGICELLRQKGYKVEQIKAGDKL